jgi:hypothetical protein
VGSRLSLFSLVSRESHQTVNRSGVTLMLVGAAIAGLLIVSYVPGDDFFLAQVRRRTALKVTD